MPSPGAKRGNQFVMEKLLMRFGLVAALATATAGFAAVTQHATHRAPARGKISDWLKQCDGDQELQCENRLLKVSFKGLCIPADDTDSYILTPKVRSWLQAHPAHNSDSIDASITAALKDIYPCSK